MLIFVPNAIWEFLEHYKHDNYLDILHPFCSEIISIAHYMDSNCFINSR